MATTTTAYFPRKHFRWHAKTAIAKHTLSTCFFSAATARAEAFGSINGLGFAIAMMMLGNGMRCCIVRLCLCVENGGSCVFVFVCGT